MRPASSSEVSVSSYFFIKFLNIWIIAFVALSVMMEFRLSRILTMESGFSQQSLAIRRGLLCPKALLRKLFVCRKFTGGI